MKEKIDISKVLFYVMSVLLMLGLTFGLGIYSGYRKTAPFKALKKVVEMIKGVAGEFSTLTKSHPEHFLEPAYYKGSGVTINDPSGDQTDLILLSGFFEKNNQIRLIRRDGTVVARWPLSVSAIFPDMSHMHDQPDTDWNMDTHGALALPDGSVVFNFEFGGLVKLDRCGQIVWTLPRVTHHSVERAEEGGYWVPGRRYYDKNDTMPFPPFDTPMNEDTLLKVSEDGEVLKEISVLDLLYENGYETLLTAIGRTFSKHYKNEVTHLNKIAELPASIADDFPMFEAGDLLLSICHHNMLMVVNPDNGRIKWLKIGPWRRQHDPEFRPGGTITVFNNNVYKNDFIQDPDGKKVYPRKSNIIEINPFTRQHSVVYGESEGQDMLTVVRGKHEFTPGGGLLITETEGGRVFETDPAGRTVWEYINRYDEDEIAEMTEARVYPAAYFHASDWSCQKNN